MTDAQYRGARSAFIRTGRIDPGLLVLLRRVAQHFVRRGGMPPIYSPTGQWNAEAEQELLADWLEARLVKGQLARILHDAATPSAFARIAETALRRHAINRLERSQAGNLFVRLRKMLPEDNELVMVQGAVRDQDKAWGLASWGGPRSVWAGRDQDLVSAAWGLGHFDTVTYRDDARKLSPLLGSDDLRRFVHGMLAAVGSALTLSQFVRALVLRFELEPVALEQLSEESDQLRASDPPFDEQVAARQAAFAAIAELTRRQVEVLRWQLGRASTRDIAKELGISVGTVSSEQKTIGSVLRRVSDPEGASRVTLLNVLRDMLFLDD